MFTAVKRATKSVLISALFARRPLALAPRLIDRLRMDPRFQAGAAAPEARMLFTVLSRVGESRAQLFQDLWVLERTDFQRSGFFVEIGAFDGEHLSNTYLLERTYGWSGILAEPDPRHREALKKRTRSSISDRCVAARSGETVEFWAASVPELSTIGRYADSDYHASRRRQHETHRLETISLLDLLKAHGAPPVVDYLSIDTEGSEYEILEAFDFASHDVRLITVEHNHGPNQAKLHALLSAKGYRQTLPDWSQFEAWYVKEGSFAPGAGAASP